MRQPCIERVLHFIGKHKVLKILCILAVGLMPPILSVWIMRRTEAQTRAKLRQAMRVRTQRLYTTPLLLDRYYLEGVGYLIGDISCQLNARSGYLRCAVNPEGPCQGCRYYEPLDITVEATPFGFYRT